MLEIFSQWYRRRFSDPQVVVLFISLIISFCIIFFFHDVLAPLLLAIALSYLLDWPIQVLNKLGFTRIVATSIILIIFIGIGAMVFLIIAPIVWQQGINLLFDLPSMVNSFNNYAKVLPERYPALVDAGIIDMIADNLRGRLSVVAESVVKYSVASLIGIMSLAIYLVLVPIMIFFLLKDKIRLISELQHILPRNHLLVRKVLEEMNEQITNYIRGKVIEMVILGFFIYIIFSFLGLRYALFLSVLISISVLIPYIGSVVVSFPVVLVALFQWGVGSDFWTLIVTYFIVQALDGNLLVPLLFSEAVNLHPLIIILSVIFFGGLWGFWGAFFAIPLATLIKAIIHVWPKENLVIQDRFYY